MNSLFVALLGLLLFSLGYYLYASFVESKVWKVDLAKKTPAVLQEDRLDYIPAKHWTILFGHHFASIAGAGPIIGPVIACAAFGWGPALLWIVVGSIFIGGIHDFSSLMLSLRHNGATVGHIAQTVISRRSRLVFSIFLWLALILVVVYVGAVAVLFLFVVMMLDIDIERLRNRFWSYLPLGAMVGLLMAAEMALVLGGKYFGEEALPGQSMPAGYSNTKELGRLLFTEYVYPFELASVILLVGIIAAVMLTLRKRKDSKYQKASAQLAVRREDCVRLVNIPSEKDEPAPQATPAKAGGH